MESKKMKDERTIELFHAALTNAEEQPGVLKALEECGYDSEKLNQGKELLKETRRIFDSCLENRDLRGIAHRDFVRKREVLNEIFLRDRTKARLVYRNDPEKAALLAVAEPVSKVYPKWFSTIRKFYKGVAADPATQEDLVRLNLTMEHINEGLAKIEEVRAARVFHMKVKAEAQNKTEAKDGSLEKMTDWMREFYGLAKLGLKREPQLLEALGKLVRS